eukprot:196676_1
MNLHQFVEEAHQHIRNGKLDVKGYHRVIRFIFWQLSVLLHWLHDDMHCCHLDLQLEHVLLKDAGFVVDPNTGFVTAKRDIAIRLCDFGSAELFKTGAFDCEKPYSSLTPTQYLSPVLIHELKYDASAADIWALGAMLFHCLTGQAVVFDDLKCEVDMSCLKHHKSGSLVRHMLREEDSERIKIMDILQHRWFKSYYG